MNLDLTFATLLQRHNLKLVQRSDRSLILVSTRPYHDQLAPLVYADILAFLAACPTRLRLDTFEIDWWQGEITLYLFTPENTNG